MSQLGPWTAFSIHTVYREWKCKLYMYTECEKLVRTHCVYVYIYIYIYECQKYIYIYIWVSNFLSCTLYIECHNANNTFIESQNWHSVCRVSEILSYTNHGKFVPWKDNFFVECQRKLSFHGTNFPRFWHSTFLTLYNDWHSTNRVSILTLY